MKDLMTYLGIFLLVLVFFGLYLCFVGWLIQLILQLFNINLTFLQSAGIALLLAIVGGFFRGSK